MKPMCCKFITLNTHNLPTHNFQEQADKVYVSPVQGCGKTHRKINHKKKSHSLAQSKEIFICFTSDCGTRFMHKAMLQRNIVSQAEKSLNMCDFCKKWFGYSHSLKTH